MVEWHQSPDYIVNNWTDELFDLMCEKFIERKQRELAAINGKPAVPTVSVETLAKTSRGMIAIKKDGN